MIEVFKTNVQDAFQAQKLIDLIHKSFGRCHANFDLEDCDRILRVACDNSPVQTQRIISLVQKAGFSIEVLGDDVPKLSPAFLQAITF